MRAKTTLRIRTEPVFRIRLASDLWEEEGEGMVEGSSENRTRETATLPDQRRMGVQFPWGGGEGEGEHYFC